MTLCEESGKVAYPSAADAHKVRRSLAKRHRTVRVYRCDRCGMWHLAAAR